MSTHDDILQEPEVTPAVAELIGEARAARPAADHARVEATLAMVLTELGGAPDTDDVPPPHLATATRPGRRWLWWVLGALALVVLLLVAVVLSRESEPASATDAIAGRDPIVRAQRPDDTDRDPTGAASSHASERATSQDGGSSGSAASGARRSSQPTGSSTTRRAGGSAPAEDAEADPGSTGDGVAPAPEATTPSPTDGGDGETTTTPPVTTTPPQPTEPAPATPEPPTQPPSDPAPTNPNGGGGSTVCVTACNGPTIKRGGVVPA